MDDDLVAKSIIRSIWFVSVSIVYSKFWYEKHAAGEKDISILLYFD